MDVETIRISERVSTGEEIGGRVSQKRGEYSTGVSEHVVRITAASTARKTSMQPPDAPLPLCAALPAPCASRNTDCGHLRDPPGRTAQQLTHTCGLCARASAHTNFVVVPCAHSYRLLISV